MQHLFVYYWKIIVRTSSPSSLRQRRPATSPRARDGNLVHTSEREGSSSCAGRPRSRPHRYQAGTPDALPVRQDDLGGTGVAIVIEISVPLQLFRSTIRLLPQDVDRGVVVEGAVAAERGEVDG